MGRDPTCDVVLDDPSASRQHAIVRSNTHGYVVEDLGSKNGTLVNGQSVTCRALCHLDEILVGAVEVRFVESVDDERRSTVVIADDQQETTTADFMTGSVSFELSARRLEMLYQLSERLMALRERDALLEDVMDICFDTLRFERGAIAVRNRNGRGVDWPIVRNLRGSGGELTISRTIFGRALDYGERSIVTDRGGQRMDPTVSMVQHGILSAMCVPLKHDDEVLGVVYGDRTTTGTQYTKEDVDFLGAIARQVTISLINSRLLEEQQDKVALEREINLAREIQTGLFPRNLPAEESYTIAALNDPGRLVSGDYYDVVRLGGGMFGFLIADVSGKGVGAAMLMSNLQAAVRLTLTGESDLGETVSRWNNLIYENTDAARFVTCLTGILDADARTLRYVTAGHHLPYVVRSDGTRPTSMVSSADYPLGIEPDATFHTRTVDLGSEPVLLFTYTDGVHEAMDPDDTEFGESRMTDVLAACADLDPQATIRRMRKAISVHCRDAVQSDDITMIAVRIG
jgi:phosphoserine phosphatase RsbU/P